MYIIYYRVYLLLFYGENVVLFFVWMVDWLKECVKFKIVDVLMIL